MPDSPTLDRLPSSSPALETSKSRRIVQSGQRQWRQWIVALPTLTLGGSSIYEGTQKDWVLMGVFAVGTVCMLVVHKWMGDFATWRDLHLINKALQQDVARLRQVAVQTNATAQIAEREGDEFAAGVKRIDQQRRVFVKGEQELQREAQALLAGGHDLGEMSEAQHRYILQQEEEIKRLGFIIQNTEVRLKEENARNQELRVMLQSAQNTSKHMTQNMHDSRTLHQQHDSQLNAQLSSMAVRFEQSAKSRQALTRELEQTAAKSHTQAEEFVEIALHAASHTERMQLAEIDYEQILLLIGESDQLLVTYLTELQTVRAQIDGEYKSLDELRATISKETRRATGRTPKQEGDEVDKLTHQLSLQLQVDQVQTDELLSQEERKWQ